LAKRYVDRKELDRAITTTYKLLKVTMSLSAAFWPQFWMQCFCLQPSLTCAKLPYLILAPILASSIATSPDRVWDCSHSGKSLFFRNRKSDTGLQI